MQQELKHFVTGDEKRFELALKDEKINKCQISDLEAVLRLVMVKVGIREGNLPNKEEKAVLIEHIVNNYGGHTCLEIKLAFEMAISSKLYEYNSKDEQVTVDANCYENFSCLYFSKVMNAYRVWSKEVYNLIPKKDIPLGIENNKQLTYEDMEKWVEETRLHVNDISKVFFIPVEIYDWLVESKNLEISKEEKFKCVGHAINIRHTQLSDIALSGNHNDTKLLNEFIAMKKTGLFVGKESETIKRLSKKIVVFNYLKNNYNERTD